MRPQPPGPSPVSIPGPRGAAGPSDGAALGASWSWGQWVAAASQGPSGGEGPGHCRGRQPGSRGQGCPEARWLCPGCREWGSRATGEASRVTAVQSGAWGRAPRSPGGQDPAHVTQRARRPSEPRCAPSPVSLPASCHRPSLGLEPGSDAAEKGRPGGNSRCWKRPCGPPRFPAELAGSARAETRGARGWGCRGCGGAGSCRGRVPRAQAQGVLMLVLP